MATKKTKKIETPIDQRETFVSIQKNFAESGISVEEKLKVLYELQQADSEIDKILQLRGELPMEVSALEDEIADLKAKCTKNEQTIEELTQSIADNKEKIEEYATAIEKYLAERENVENSRQYSSISKDIENTDLEKQIAEKSISEAKVKISERKESIEVLKEKIAIREADLEAKKEELATIVESTAAEEQALEAKRNACAEKIDARTLSAYDRIRSSNRNHLAVVSVFNGACGGCFNSIAPQRLIDIASNKKLIVCEYCGRILVNPDFE